MPVIELSNVKKSYRGRTLYEDVNLTIPEGRITALSGPNGTGKSVLFRLMCGFLSPDEGQVTIDPRFMSQHRTFPDRFGVIIDRPGYLPGRTGKQNLQDLAGIRNAIGDKEIEETMRTIGLDPSLSQKVRHYSLGMKQKLALAQALMEKPDVLILDEPFNALDADTVTNVKALLCRLRDDGTTIVFTSHNRDDVDDLAERELIIKDGSVATNDSVGG